jgi:hypothetical protein
MIDDSPWRRDRTALERRLEAAAKRVWEVLEAEAAPPKEGELRSLLRDPGWLMVGRREELRRSGRGRREGAEGEGGERRATGREGEGRKGKEKEKGKDFFVSSNELLCA